MSADARAAGLGLELGAAPGAVANYQPAVRAGDLLFLSGHLPLQDGAPVRGRLGDDLTIEQGYEAARLAAVQLLASLRAALGSLDGVEQIVKLLCVVNSTADFVDQPQVANGASDLLVEVFGEAGRHARSAIGGNSLPLGAAVEIELIARVREA